MIGHFNPLIELIDLAGKGDTDIEAGQVSLRWGALKELLLLHEQRRDKDGACFIPVGLKDRSEWVVSESESEKPSFRNDQNVESISLVTLDLDKPGALEKARDVFKDNEYVIYSTHSHSKESPYKYRMVLLPESPILADEWPDVFRALSTAVDGDPQCGNFSRVYYFPSANPASGMEPYSEHHAGSPVSSSTIRAIQKAKGPGQPKSAKSPRREKHFSGSSKFPNRKGSKKDFSYEGFSRRHKRFIDELSADDSRHFFALKVIGREIAIQKESPDIFNLIQFIYRATKEHSSRAITDPGSNTEKELYSGLKSSITKFVPSLIQGDAAPISDLRGYVDGIIKVCRAKTRSNDWDFPGPPAEESESESDADTLSSWRERHIDLLRSLNASGDLDTFAKTVCHREIQDEQPEIPYNKLAQFLILTSASYLAYQEKLDLAPMIGKGKEIVMTAALDTEAPDQQKKFLVGAINVGLIRLEAGKSEFAEFNEKVESQSEMCPQ